MARLLFYSLFLFVLIIPNQSARHGSAPEILHVGNEMSSSPTIIEPEMFGAFVLDGTVRSKRDTSSTQTSKTNTAPVSTSAAADKSSKKITNPSTMTVNGRSNMTMQTTNNITTMVSITFASPMTLSYDSG